MEDLQTTGHTNEPLIDDGGGMTSTRGKSNISREDDAGELASGGVTLHVIRTVVEND